MSNIIDLELEIAQLKAEVSKYKEEHANALMCSIILTKTLRMVQKIMVDGLEQARREL